MEKYRKTIELCSSIMKEIKAERMSNTKMGKYVNVFSLWNEFSGKIVLVCVFGVYWF